MRRSDQENWPSGGGSALFQEGNICLEKGLPDVPNMLSFYLILVYLLISILHCCLLTREWCYIEACTIYTKLSKGLYLFK